MAQEQIQEEQNKEAPVAPTEVEVRALEMGWKPKEDFDPDSGKEWIPADEFVRRKPLFDKIEAMSKELKNVRNGLDAFKQHHEKVKQTEYARAKDELLQQRKVAIDEQDATKAFEVSDKLRELELEQQRASQEKVGETNPAFQEWLTENSWYAKDEELREFADALGIMYAKKYTPAEVLVKVSEKVREKYSEKFRNPNKDKGSAVETASGKPRAAKSNDSFQLNDMEKQIMQKLVRSGAMTEAEYIKELKRTRGE